MENQQAGVEVVKQKDYWRLTYKNFLHISYFAFFLFVVGVILYTTKTLPAELTILGVLSILAYSIGWFALAQLFKKHHKQAVNIGYIVLGILTILSFSTGLNLITVIILAYFFWLVYKVSQMPASPTV